MTSIGFSKVWLLMGTFALASGWLILSTATLPWSLGWWGMIGGGALGLAQFVWTHEGVWFAPYLAF